MPVGERENHDCAMRGIAWRSSWMPASCPAGRRGRARWPDASCGVRQRTLRQVLEYSPQSTIRNSARRLPVLRGKAAGDGRKTSSHGYVLGNEVCGEVRHRQRDGPASVRSGCRSERADKKDTASENPSRGSRSDAVSYDEWKRKAYSPTILRFSAIRAFLPVSLRK